MKAKRYADGGTVKRSYFEEMEDLGNVGKLSSMGRGMSKAEAAQETGRSQAQAARGRAAARGESEQAPAAPSTAPGQSFAQAFRAARGRGDRTFEWRGRRYTTEMASAPRRFAPPREPSAEEREAEQPADLYATRFAPPREMSAAEREAEQPARLYANPRSAPQSRSTYTGTGPRPALGGVSLNAKGGHIKKMASGGTCRGMGKATRGGDYKVR